jgi:hypothetical protein
MNTGCGGVIFAPARPAFHAVSWQKQHDAATNQPKTTATLTIRFIAEPSIEDYRTDSLPCYRFCEP